MNFNHNKVKSFNDFSLGLGLGLVGIIFTSAFQGFFIEKFRFLPGLVTMCWLNYRFKPGYFLEELLRMLKLTIALGSNGVLFYKGILLFYCRLICESNLPFLSFSFSLLWLVVVSCG